jgi:hypothetical protein
MTDEYDNSFDALGRDWIDISSEYWRTYLFPDGTTVKVDSPQYLHVSESGGHRIYDKGGESWYINSGWVAIKWKAQPAFVA